MKDIIYHANTAKDIADFPEPAKQRIAQLLSRLADDLKLQPNDFKYMSSVGKGVYELRIRLDKQYRVFYLAKFNEVIYVLHAFIKKTQKTPQKEIDKGKKRYQELRHFRQGGHHEKN